MQTETERRRLGSIASQLERRVDASGLCAFRVLFGAVMVLSTIRFVAMGWIDSLYVEPSFHFTYLGFDWVQPWSRSGMYAHVLVVGGAALGIAIGAHTRFCAVVFFLSFTYLELLEKAAYLNHYYLVSLLALLLVCVPTSQRWSISSGRRRSQPDCVPRLSYGIFQVQIALVYLFAALWKLSPDWLESAQPLTIWLRARTDLPWIGPWMDAPWLAYGMSWGGAAFDLLIIPALLWHRTRRWAFATAVFFHGVIWMLFPIGMFSLVMITCLTLFLEPGWPRLLQGRGAWPQPSQLSAKSARIPRWVLLICALHLCIQVLVPLRFALYPGAVSWTEEGFRFSWRVMLIEKTGHVEFRVETDRPGQGWVVRPAADLTVLQAKQMSTQPDMVHQYAIHVAQTARAAGHTGVRVYADAWSSLNGRESQRFIDPETDLGAEPRHWRHARFILPLLPGR